MRGDELFEQRATPDHQSPEEAPMAKRSRNTSPCSMPDCDRPFLAKGMCRLHYERVWRGIPMDLPIRIEGPLEKRFWAKVDKRGPDECWEWQGWRNKTNYGHISRGGHRGRQPGTHIVSWEIHNGPISDGLWVLHKCDNPPCCNPAHLFLGTRQDNVDDMVSKGRQIQGTRAHFSKFTDDDIIKIRQMYRDGMVQREIGRIFDTDQANISCIVRRKTWKHLP